ncbi:MAG: YceI family protein [Pseudonocardiaceae bacterium]
MSDASMPGYGPGRWTIDPARSEVCFTVRHMMFSKVRGRFTDFEGWIVTGDDLPGSSVQASIDLASIDTGDSQRDEFIRSADVGGASDHPAMTYVSSEVRPDGDGWVVDGELTIRDVTRAVPLALEITGFGPDPSGGTAAGFRATAEINRRDFGVEIPMDGAGMLVGETVWISLDIRAVLQES